MRYSHFSIGQKLQKFPIGWPSRAGRKTTEIPDRLDPPSRHKNYRNSGSAGPAEPPQKLQTFGICWLLVVGWLVACTRPRGPLRGQKRQKFRIGWTRRAARKTSEIPDRLDPPSRQKNVKKSGFAGWLLLVDCTRPRGPLRGQ